ncbi:polysaccharide deacetylase family protein [Clostridiisalibacter paucivorans]|uniref:polysaccharide deacetylase family protein n=1 Tax=Clostridiisalibacter paucivorans TaxID=408753 RepID=UPI0004797E65|nr:polysaccharide deacetylase family protein [Clostridiisalibacter paucivorans]
MKVFFINYKKVSIIALIIVILLILFMLILNFQRSSEVFNNKEDVFYKGNIDEKVVAFTCNVDWGEEYLPKMFEIFEENNIHITFFVTGKWAEKNTDLLIKMKELGHEIGSHGYSHKDYGNLNYEENRNEIKKANDIIMEKTGLEPVFFAPPSGSYNDQTVIAAKEFGYKVIMWDVDTIDWRKDSTKEKITSRVMNKVRKGSIVLMHPKEETIKALPTIIKLLMDRGYKIGKVSDIIA